MVRLEEVSKTFAIGRQRLQAVAPTSLEVAEGEIFGVVGFSGAGKSTLLRLINLLERPTSGRVFVGEQELTALGPAALRQARRAIGMIFQSFNLLSNRTALENVEFALEIAGVDRATRRRRALECLAIVGLEEKVRQYPAQLSGGQRQRVAIARALANQPKLLLCDEATSALDPHTTLAILQFLRQINQEFRVTMVVVSHEINVVRYLCQRVAVMDAGRIVEELDLRDPTSAPTTPLGRFLLETAQGWTPETRLPEAIEVSA
ncbi:MAG: ATP-binding cassette domain-containing protein [Chloroflexi bacterium]|nr:ATP-binding cassette domain-containing protein [Chloroflexota bacterium]